MKVPVGAKWLSSKILLYFNILQIIPQGEKKSYWGKKSYWSNDRTYQKICGRLEMIIVTPQRLLDQMAQIPQQETALLLFLFFINSRYNSSAVVRRNWLAYFSQLRLKSFLPFSGCCLNQTGFINVEKWHKQCSVLSEELLLRACFQHTNIQCLEDPTKGEQLLLSVFCGLLVQLQTAHLSHICLLDEKNKPHFTSKLT